MWREYKLITASCCLLKCLKVTEKEGNKVFRHKKRKEFHGVRKQDKIKRVRLSEASPVASITFVYDEDVVADRLPETPISAPRKS